MPVTLSRETRQGCALDGRRPMRILVASPNAVEAESFIHEFQRAQFALFSQVARDAREFVALLRSQTFDVVVSVDAMGEWTGLQALELLHQSDPQVPFILVSDNSDDVVTEYMLSGAADCVDRNRPSLLPLAAALAVEERRLLDERKRAEEELSRSQALYSALSDNPAYGICRLDEQGRPMEANQALVTMLGYSSQAELLAAYVATSLIASSSERAQLLEDYQLVGCIDRLEVELTHKDGTPIKARVAGRRINDETAVLDGCEVIVEDITTQRALEDHLRQLAATDPLTGLANYRRLVEVVDAEIKRSQRTGRPFAVLLFDLNGLKQINDQYGHLSGDRALRRLANAFRLSCRSIDTAARYAGDEFAIVLPETGVREARAIGRRICEHLALDPEVPRVSTSMGASSHPRDGNTLDELVRSADRALYQVKRRAERPINRRTRLTRRLRANAARSRLDRPQPLAAQE